MADQEEINTDIVEELDSDCSSTDTANDDEDYEFDSQGRCTGYRGGVYNLQADDVFWENYAKAAERRC